jgi:hypothetical protein
MLSVFAASAVVAGACSSSPEVKPVVNTTTTTSTPGATPSPAVSPSVNPSVDPKAAADDKKVDAVKVEALTGKWPGVEGTYLDVTKKGDKYSVAIKDLDKVETFEGTAKGDAIEFTRKGKAETIKAATGDETGMKWLAGKKTCVVITKGSEGYCKS